MGGGPGGIGAGVCADARVANIVTSAMRPMPISFRLALGSDPTTRSRVSGRQDDPPASLPTGHLLVGSDSVGECKDSVDVRRLERPLVKQRNESFEERGRRDGIAGAGIDTEQPGLPVIEIVIDLERGRVLAPGLIDNHVHITRCKPGIPTEPDPAR